MDLYVPERFPNIKDNFDKLRGLNYQELAFEIIKLFFGDIGDENIRECIKTAYEGEFEVKVNKGYEIPEGLKGLEKKYLIYNIKCDKLNIKNVISSLIKKV